MGKLSPLFMDSNNASLATIPRMLIAQAVCKWQPTPEGRLSILRDVCFCLDQGESMAVMGPSGSGKSTLLNILGTLDAPSSGRVLLHGQDPATLTRTELARFRNQFIGFVFQDHHLLPQLSALENVQAPALAGWNHPSGYAKLSSTDVLRRAQTLLESVGMSHRMTHFPSQLSGGERQRTAIARALMQGPQLILADEPTGNLDRTSAEGVTKLLSGLVKTCGAALVIVTHSHAVASAFARQLALEDGVLSQRR